MVPTGEEAFTTWLDPVLPQHCDRNHWDRLSGGAQTSLKSRRFHYDLTTGLSPESLTVEWLLVSPEKPLQVTKRRGKDIYSGSPGCRSWLRRLSQHRGHYAGRSVEYGSSPGTDHSKTYSGLCWMIVQLFVKTTNQRDSHTCACLLLSAMASADLSVPSAQPRT